MHGTSVVQCYCAGLLVNWSSNRSCTRSMIQNKIHLISLGCLLVSMALQMQNRILKHHSFCSVLMNKKYCHSSYLYLFCTHELCRVYKLLLNIAPSQHGGHYLVTLFVIIYRGKNNYQNIYFPPRYKLCEQLIKTYISVLHAPLVGKTNSWLTQYKDPFSVSVHLAYLFTKKNLCIIYYLMYFYL